MTEQNNNDPNLSSSAVLLVSIGFFGMSVLMNSCDARRYSKDARDNTVSLQYRLNELNSAVKTMSAKPSRPSHDNTYLSDIIGGPGKDRFAYNTDGTITLLEIDGDVPKTCPAYTRNILGSPAMDVYEQCPDGTITILEIDGKRPGDYDPKTVSQYARPPLPFRITSGQK